MVTRFQSINSPKADWPPHWVVEPRQGMPSERAFSQGRFRISALGNPDTHIETFIWEHVQKPEKGFRVLRCHSPPYFLDMVPLAEPEACWWLSSCSDSPVSPSHNTGTHKVTFNLVYRFLDLNTSSYLLTKCCYWLSRLPSPRAWQFLVVYCTTVVHWLQTEINHVECLFREFWHCVNSIFFPNALFMYLLLYIFI